MKPEVEARFWSKVDASGDCWLWTSPGNSAGYGRFTRHHGDADYAHRIAYQILVGPIPEGMQLDHLCRVRLCVNPDHLEPVTRRENILRGFSPAALHARQQVCGNGHPYGAQSLSTVYLDRGLRRCLMCSRERYNPAKRAAQYRSLMARRAVA